MSATAALGIRSDGWSTAAADHTRIGALAPVTILASGFKDLSAVAVEAGGAVLVTDRADGTLTRIDASGRRDVLLDNLHRPSGVAVEPAGGVLVIEQAGKRLLRLTSDGLVAIVASGLRQARSVAVGVDGRVWVSMRRGVGHDHGKDVGRGAEHVIARLEESGALTPFASGFKDLQGLAADGGAVYVVMARLATDRGPLRTTVARVPIGADGSAGRVEPMVRNEPHRPRGVAVDAAGDVFVSGVEHDDGHEGSGVIVKRRTGGRVSTLAAGLREPVALAFASNGDLVAVEKKKPGRVLRFRAPPAPLPAAPAFTNQTPLPIGGHAGPGNRVQVFRAADLTRPLATTMADAASGRFTLRAPLAPNSETDLSFVTTATAGSGLASPATTARIVHDDHLPRVIVAEPFAGSYVRDTTTLRARGEDEGSGISAIAFMLDDAVVATVKNDDPAHPLVATALLDARPLVEGPHTLTVVATDQAANSAAVAQLVVVDRTPPDTRIVTGPPGETAERTAIFTFSGADVQSANLDFAWRLNGSPWSAFSASPVVELTSIAPGTHRFEVKARDRAGNEDPTPAAQTFSVTALSIRITEPVAGTVIATDAVWVRGVVVGRDVSVTILLPPDLLTEFLFPDVPAAVEAGTFAVRMPVASSTTTLTVTATGAQGGSATDSVAILVQAFPTSEEEPLGVSPPIGFAPHTVQFGVLASTGSSLALDIESDGTLEFDEATLADRNFTYERPGIYVATLRETTPEGVVFTHRTVVEVYDRAALDARLQAAWRGFKETVAAGDVSQAVAFVHSNRRSRWEEAFRQLTPEQLTTADTVFTTIELVEIRPGLALYDMRREDDGVMYSFPIEFALDTDGRWRLWQF